MILYQLKKNNNKDLDLVFGKWYAFPVITHTVGIKELAKLMAETNTGFSVGQVKGMLADMVKCIKKEVLSGAAVKIDDLAIFTLGIVNKEGADSKKDFNVAKNVESVKLRSRATGELTSQKLNLEASLKNIEKLTKNGEEDGDDGGENISKPSTGGEGSGGSSSDSGSTVDPGDSGSGDGTVE